ncbi:F0F1-ATPase subunit family protein [Parafrankia soli]|uniref:F0F1-ATPase subunit family protein n=1 Tax=Parafrankia soli TaxID=2599596 RepID=A0A1S1RLB5_9ACTN|nr:F0F1-ATPase subunit family protein [Parafrankia soli]TCJ40383.1 F0F1-ATPase subunit family protein [Parafrankia sp. BMG5.11]
MVGLGIDRLAGFDALFFPIGLIVGIIASLYLVIYRFGARR